MYKDKKILALITARKNSIRLKKKNFLTFFKKPLIYWTISSALKSRYLDNIYLSTDMIEILKYSKKFKKIKTLKRKKSLSTSNTSSYKVLNDFLKKQKNYDYICLLQPTSPLRTYKDIDRSIKKIIEKKSTSLISISKRINGNFKVSLSNEGLLKNKSIKNRKYYINGAVYIAKMRKKKTIKSFMTSKTLGYIMPKSRSIDIDNLNDFKKAENYIKNKTSSI